MSDSGLRRESLLQSQLMLVGAQGLQIGLGFILTVALVRTLSDAAFGSFVFASAWMIMASRVVDAGLSPALVRGLIEDQQTLWHRVFSLRTGLAALFALVTPLVFIANEDLAMTPTLRFAVGVGVAMAIFALPLRSWHQRFAAWQRNRSSALISFWSQSIQVSLALLALALWGARALPFVIGALAGREFLNSVLPWILGRRVLARKAAISKAGSRSTPGTPESKKEVGLLSLSLATVATALYFHIDVFMIEAWKGTEEVARYGLALRVLAPLLAAVHLVSAPVLPFVVRARSPEHRARVLVAAMICLGAATVPLGGALWLGPGIVDLLSGREGHPAQELMPIMAVVPFAVVWGALGSATLIALGRTRSWALIALGGLALNLALNARWIPARGALGAAEATALTECLVGLLAGGLAIWSLKPRRLFSGVSPTALAKGGGFAGLLLAVFVGLSLSIDAKDSQGAVVVWVLAAAAAGTWTMSGPAQALRRRIESEAIDS